MLHIIAMHTDIQCGPAEYFLLLLFEEPARDQFAWLYISLCMSVLRF